MYSRTGTLVINLCVFSKLLREAAPLREQCDISNILYVCLFVNCDNTLDLGMPNGCDIRVVSRVVNCHLLF